MQRWLRRITTRRARRTRARIQPRPTCPPLPTTQALLRPHQATSKGRRPAKVTILVNRRTNLRMINLRTIQAMESSRNTRQLSRLRLCSTTTSRTIPATTTSGRPATGPGLQMGIIGCPAPGSRLPTRAHSGPPATGATGITPTGSTPATGDSTSATMAELITALATRATATRAVTGAGDTSTTTVQSTTLISVWCTTSIVARSSCTRPTPM